MLVNILKQAFDKRFCSFGLLGVFITLQSTVAVGSEAILKQHCLGCHTQESANPLKLSRISHQRKTPEGWLMTIGRMQTTHGLQIKSNDRAKLVEYLANNQGLTPKEAQPYRYILERRSNYRELKQPELAQMCARCHSEARIGLQRREQAEWGDLVNFHLGQWPTLEFSQMGRDRQWFKLAMNEVVPFLGKNYALDMKEWQQWQSQSKPAVDGIWRVAGNMPSKGQFQGNMILTLKGKNYYKVDFSGQFDNGELLKGIGKVLIYSDFEWRGSLTIDGKKYLQIFAVNHQNKTLKGRMFLDENEEIGINIQGVHGEQSQILALSPSSIKAGETKNISIRGHNLNGSVSLGGGLKVLAEISRSADEIIVKVQAPSVKHAISTEVTVGDASITGKLSLYDRVSEIKVFPSYAIARIGDGGGTEPKVKAFFETKAYAAGADGKAGTVDDVYLGNVPATWSVAPFDQQAIDDEDVKFAGVIDAHTGVFTPGDAGPNPERKYGTNNVGHLSVIATYKNGETVLKATSELIATVQRFNNPPIQ